MQREPSSPVFIEIKGAQIHFDQTTGAFFGKSPDGVAFHGPTARFAKEPWYLEFMELLHPIGFYSSPQSQLGRAVLFRANLNARR